MTGKTERNIEILKQMGVKKIYVHNSLRKLYDQTSKHYLELTS